MGESAAEVESVLYSPVSMVFQILITSSFLSFLALVPLKSSGRSVSVTLRLARVGFTQLMVAALAVIPLGFLVDEATYLLHLAGPDLFDPSGLERMAEIFSGASWPGFVAVTLAVTLGPALGEELLFRGFLLRAFSDRSPTWLSVGVTAVLFGAIHMNALQGAGAFLIGIYLGFAVIITGSIWVGVAGHAVNNLACSLFARFDPGGAGTAFASGHHPAVLAVSLVGIAAAIVYLKRTAQSS